MAKVTLGMATLRLTRIYVFVGTTRQRSTHDPPTRSCFIQKSIASVKHCTLILSRFLLYERCVDIVILVCV